MSEVFPVAKHTYTYVRGVRNVYIMMTSPGIGTREVASFPRVGGFLLANEWAKKRGVKLDYS